MREDWHHQIVDSPDGMMSPMGGCDAVTWLRTSALTFLMVSAVFVSLPICSPSVVTPPTLEADVIVTAAPVYQPHAEITGKERFPSGAHLLLLHGGKAEPLLPAFTASADAQVSFDGKSVLFSGKEQASDPWQIWELTLADHRARKIITADSVRPFYLPYGRLLYARRTPSGYQLETAEINGSHISRLSYLPTGAMPADVLQDGRILFEAGYPLGVGTTPELYLTYADGSGVESYRCDHGRARWGGRQLSSGDVVFTHGASLARFTSPLSHEERIAAPVGDYAGGIVETEIGSWLVSMRASMNSQYGLKLWRPGSANAQTLLTMKGENLIDPVLVRERTRPKRHPSGLHDWNYANLLALDVRQSRDGDLKSTPASVRLEARNEEGHTLVIGTAPIESDGSFFVKAPSDKPIRFALLDARGAVVRQEQGGFWIRSGEQRICVGCHAGPERASENQVPAVLFRSTTPVDLTGTAQLGSLAVKNRLNARICKTPHFAAFLRFGVFVYTLGHERRRLDAAAGLARLQGIPQ